MRPFPAALRLPNFGHSFIPATTGTGICPSPTVLISGSRKYVYNVTGFFERDGLNVRVAYNWRSRDQRWMSTTNPYQNEFYQPNERLDASINYDITKNLTVALEGRT